MCIRDSAGIKVKMITGDHAGTAAEIGAQLGIGTGKAAELIKLAEEEKVDLIVFDALSRSADPVAPGGRAQRASAQQPRAEHHLSIA